MPCAEPALDITGVRFALTELTARLVVRMETAAQGARSWRLTAFHADGGSSCVAIRLSKASRDRTHVLHLFEDKLDRIDPGYGIDGFLLEAADCDAVEASQTSLVAGQNTAATAANEVLAAELSGLVDRLAHPGDAVVDERGKLVHRLRHLFGSGLLALGGMVRRRKA